MASAVGNGIATDAHGPRGTVLIAVANCFAVSARMVRSAVKRRAVAAVRVVPARGSDCLPTVRRRRTMAADYGDCDHE